MRQAEAIRKIARALVPIVGYYTVDGQEEFGQISKMRFEDEETGSASPAAEAQALDEALDRRAKVKRGCEPAFTESERQAVLLSLAICSFERRGWLQHLTDIAAKFGDNGVELFHSFRTTIRANK